MPRVKGGYTTRRRRKAVLKLAKGYYGSKHALYRTANEQVMRSLAYSYRDRKVRKRDFRKLWIQRINAACKLNGMKYSSFINGLSKANVEINRKMLAEMAVSDAAGFAAICEIAKKGLAAPAAKSNEKVVVLKTQSKAEKEALKASSEVKATPAKKETVKEEVKPAAKKEVKAPAKEEAKDYSKMTVAELKEEAKARGVKLTSTMKKADIIAELSK